MTAAETERLPRCCPNHDDWRTLTEHLVDDFVEVAAGDVVRETTRAKRAVEAFGVDECEQVAVAELMVRHQLMMLSGRLPDIARLDPERHVRQEAAT